jgi:hypothetical protein
MNSKRFISLSWMSTCSLAIVQLAFVPLAIVPFTAIHGTVHAAPPAGAAEAIVLQRDGAMFALVAIEWLAPVSAADSQVAAADAGGMLALALTERENSLCAATLALVASQSNACPVAWIGAYHTPQATGRFDWRDRNAQTLAFSAFLASEPTNSSRIPLVAVLDPTDGSWRSSTVGPEAGARCQHALLLFPMPIDDCDNDGVPDGLALATGLVADCNSDGLPDTCAPLGDLNGDGSVSAPDLAILLTNFGSNVPSSDLDCDGIVNAVDLAILLSNWS